jgi:hypothetical protein
MRRPTKPPHYGLVRTQNSFLITRQNLVLSGLKKFLTKAGTPFTAEAHIDGKGKHKGQQSIVIKRDNKIRAYIYECCWGHVTNCNRTYIDIYTSIL